LIDHKHIKKGASIKSVDDKTIDYLLGATAASTIIKLFGKNAPEPTETTSTEKGELSA
jgi:hypothetical protein